MKIFAETERLILRELLPGDLEGLFALDADPEVHRYLGNEPLSTREEAAAIIDYVRQQYLDHGIGRWAVIDKTTKDFLGWSGLKFVTELTNHHQHYYDLGYRLRKKYWGRGIGTESALASLNYAFEKLGTREVYAMADCKNIASNRILEKTGLSLIEKFEYEGAMHNWYEIKKNDYENRRQLF